jgi:hypothetical protein
MALHTVKQSAEQKDTPVFLHFEKPSKDQIKPDFKNINLNDVMQNIGAPQFSYDTFKRAFDEDPRIEQLIHNFSAEGIEVTKDPKDTSDQSQDGKNSVSDMAKAATDLSDN